MSRVPKLRFKEFRGEWEEKFLKEIAEIKTGPFGSTLHEEDYVEIGTPIITVEHLGENGVIHRNLPLVSNEDKIRLKAYLLKQGDIVFSRVGSVDRSCLIKEMENGWLFSGRLLRIRIHDAKQTSAFLNQSFKNEIVKHRIRSVAVGQTMPSLNTEILKNFPLNFPFQLEEQQKISDFLSAVDTKIDQLTRKKELFEQYKKGVMQKIFSQELRFKADDGSEFPEWEAKKLGDICFIKKGSQLNRDGLDVVGQYAVINGGISPSGYNDEWNTEANTITISEGGNSCGYVSFMTEKFWSGGHCYTLENIESTVKNEYLFQYLKAYEIQIMRLRVGSGLPNIQKGEISKFIVKIPYINEQTKIASFLSAIDTKIDLVTKQLDVSKNFKKGLLQQMFV